MAEDLSGLIKSFQQASEEQTTETKKQTEHLDVSNISLDKLSHGLENISERSHRQALYLEQANLLQNKLAGTMEKLLMATQTQELGTGKHDENILTRLSEIERQTVESATLDPKEHAELLGDIRESLKAGQLSLSEKLERFWVNNVKVWGNLGDSVKRIFGANIFEQKRKKIIEEQEARTRELQEESFTVSALTHKLLATDMITELQTQTDLMMEMLDRTPTDAEREEAEMEARRRRRMEQNQANLVATRGGRPGGPGLPGGDDGGGLFGWVGSAIMGWLGGKELLRSVKNMGGFKNFVKTKFLGMSNTAARGAMLTAGEALTTQPGMTGKPPRWSVKDPITKKFVSRARAIQLGLVDDTGRVILNSTDDALKATRGAKGLLDVGKASKTVMDGMKTITGTALGRVMPVFAGISATIATGKDIFDIHSAMTDDDIRTAVQWEDIGGVAGSIVGGAVGFIFGGPAGAALAADLGNTIGGSVGDLFDDPNIKKNLDETLEQMREKVEKATGARKEIEQKKLDDFEKAIDAEREALLTTDAKMDAKVEEIRLLKEQRDEAIEQGDLYNQALLEAKLIKAESEQQRLNRIRQENVEELKAAMRDTLTAEGIRASEETGFFEELAQGKGPLARMASLFADDDARSQLEGKILALDAVEEEVFEQANTRKKKEMEAIKKQSKELENAWYNQEEQTEEGLQEYLKKQANLIKEMEQVAVMGTALEEARLNASDPMGVLSKNQGMIRAKSIEMAMQKRLETLLTLTAERDEMKTKMGLNATQPAGPTIIDNAKTIITQTTKKVTNSIATGAKEIKLAAAVALESD